MIYEEFKITPAGMSPWYDYNTTWLPNWEANIREFVFNRSTVGDRVLLSFSGLGMPDIEFLSNKTPYNDGELVSGFRAQKREISLTLHANGCSREEYWNLRSELIEALRPRTINNGETGASPEHKIYWWLNGYKEGSMAPARLTITLPGGKKRAIEVYYMDGAVFQPRNLDDWDEFGFEDTITLYAPYPYLFDPEFKVAILPSGVDAIYVEYNGTAKSKPVLEIRNISYAGPDGPGNMQFTYNSLPNNQHIALNYTPVTGTMAVINTESGRKNALIAYNGSLGNAGLDISEYIQYNNTGFAEFSLGPYGSRNAPSDPNWANNTIARLGHTVGLETHIKYYEYYIGI